MSRHDDFHYPMRRALEKEGNMVVVDVKDFDSTAICADRTGSAPDRDARCQSRIHWRA